MLGHDAVAQALVDHGVDTVFAVLGDGNLFIGENLQRQHGTNLIGATHEANAVCMAEGWAKASGKLGVASVTHGPGLTNTITALVEGVKNETPMLVVAGDTPVENEQHLQNLDQHALVTASGAGFQPVRNAETIAEDVSTAIRRAHSERRPIVLNVPLNIEWDEVEYVSRPPLNPSPVRLAPDPDQLDTALGIIASSTRPLILAGRGAVKSGAKDALLRLGETLGAPLATSLLGTGYFEGEPFNLGIHGTLSHEVAGETLAIADCVIAFGASLNFFTTDYQTLLAGKRVVHVDIDARHIDRHVTVDAGVVGDAAVVASAMNDLLNEAEHKASSFRTNELKSRLEAFDPAQAFEDKSYQGAVDPRTLTRRLEAGLPKERQVVVDAGRFMLDALTMSVPKPENLVTSHGFGAIGLGMSTAIGAAVARPTLPTIVCIGDGGYMMGGLTELSTAVHLGLDLIVIVYNDGSYGAEHIQLVTKGMDPTASLHEWPDFCAVAESMGCQTMRIESLDDIDAAIDVVKNRTPGRPVLIEARTDPDVVSTIYGHHR
ncbi:MAG TPA: acetolactate synthase [Acidimicrobiaceae bacterium]|jgi:acetolactate synthase-1/2/3 large subunit|nr:acetolactate synthase [Acidimicrobiaceae bacterium]HCK74945.1 acetolactate synthase [Acidimicrobiaceae bacterium]|tara:strand:- start:642 stop:2279 length:1638 start_codon:yes stop_codon:yes gene_type:complete